MKSLKFEKFRIFTLHEKSSNTNFLIIDFITGAFITGDFTTVVFRVSARDLKHFKQYI